jgi:hypothetical protein
VAELMQGAVGARNAAASSIRDAVAARQEAEAEAKASKEENAFLASQLDAAQVIPTIWHTSEICFEGGLKGNKY